MAIPKIVFVVYYGKIKIPLQLYCIKRYHPFRYSSHYSLVFNISTTPKLFCLCVWGVGGNPSTAQKLKNKHL